MEGHSSPYNWFSHVRNRKWKRRGSEMMIKLASSHSIYHSIYSPPDLWWAHLSQVQTLAKDGWVMQDVLECYAQLLCQALEVSHDCKRTLHRHEGHQIRVLANPRAIQVYCCHNTDEKGVFRRLARAHFYFNYYRRNDIVEEQNYEEFTRDAYLQASKFLAWECILPEGIDMEALSPRDTNAHLRAKQPAQKLKPPVPKVSQKEKDHPPPPPAEVREPPCSDRRNGATYMTGKCLGKGGFAICYEGQLAGTRQVYALKMVKSHMPMKKMEQKVGPASNSTHYTS